MAPRKVFQSGKKMRNREIKQNFTRDANSMRRSDLQGPKRTFSPKNMFELF